MAQRRRFNYKLIILILALLLILSGSRLVWMHAFNDIAPSTIKDGHLSLYNWDASDGDVLLLDGEWEFYPSQWLMDGEQALHYDVDVDMATRHLVQVPGRWNEALNEEDPTSFGFGSYRLRIAVNPEENINYSLHVPSVRSASELYVNGRLIAGSGQIETSEHSYVAKNLPYSASFTADEQGLIDIVIQAANFKDIRQSGIIRSIKFGSEAAISNERSLSLSMQVLASVIFLLHCIYAVVLYVLGSRDKKLLYFSMLLLCITLMNLVSSDEKIFHLLFYVGYEWDFRLANVTIPLGCFAFLNCIDHRKLPYRQVVYPVYAVLTIGIAAVTLLLSPSQIIMMFPVYYALAGIAALMALTTVVKRLFSDVTENTLLLLSLVTIAHHFVWMSYWRESGISVVHYPFDMIVAIVCFASIWFKDYFKMHAETKQLASTLQQMNEHKDQFLAHTSHEFKNPLHSIINMSQSILMRERYVLRAESVRELDTILTVGQRLSLLLNDLLDVASLREGQPRLNQKKMTLQPIVTGVIDMLQFIVAVKPVKIINNISDDFPPVLADENRVIQIVYNIVHNAVKFTDEGSIHIDAEAKEGMAWLTIRDTGVGMEKPFLARIFQPYEQAANEEGNRGGLGLGLNISKQLVELHGGVLEVSSIPGEGSAFTFSLPLAAHDAVQDSAPDIAGIARADVTPADAIPAGGLAQLQHVVAAHDTNRQAAVTTEEAEDAVRWPILIVDDDPINLQVLQSILSDEPYNIATALSGQDALSQIDDQDWGLIISDIMMPYMSGYELTAIIRKRYSLTELPVLLLTARHDPKDIQAGFLAGANDYVTKPVERLEFKSRVRALTMTKNMVRDQLDLEAAWLQAQIQPHFLFNTLNSIIALSSIDVDKMSDLLIELSEFLRSKFQFHLFDKLISVREELNIVRSYLKIEQVRFGQHLNVAWEIEPFQDFNIPFLTIQPLVENAIRHGIMKQINGGTITIRIAVRDNDAEISVIDDGVGMSASQLQSLFDKNKHSRSGVGLINTHLRLVRHFGEGLQVESEPDQGTCVSFVVPL